MQQEPCQEAVPIIGKLESAKTTVPGLRFYS